jgi:DNA-binding beta-propeller fold protein YncE
VNEIFFGVPMSFRRVGRLAAMVLLTLLCLSCGQVYRPVVIPLTTTPPSPTGFHTVFAISANVPSYPGGAMQIDVSGDSIVAETPSSDKSAPNLGNNPTHAAILPNLSRVFVASAGSMTPGGVDVVSSFSPAFQSTVASGLGAVSAISMPSLPGQTSGISALSEVGNVVTVTLTSPLLAGPSRTDLVLVGTPVVITGEATAALSGYNGTFTIAAITPTTLQYLDTTATALPACAPNALPIPPCPSAGAASIPGQPVYLASTDSGAMYVANFNSNSVAKINTTTNTVTNSATVYQPAVAASPAPNPVGMAETPNTFKIYVANQGNNTVSSLNTVDLSPNVVTGFAGTNPVWVVARGDSQKVYVLTEGDGQLVTIDVATDTVTSSLSVGAGANFIFYDSHLNRLYVTNPVTSTVYVLSDTGGANDTPIQLAAISFAQGSAACPGSAGACSPASVTALPDGSRFYVASYQTATSCPDPTVTGPCVIPGLAVFDANSLALKTTMTLLTNPPFSVGVSGQYQYAVPTVLACAPATLYSPATTRFRVFTTAAADSSRVYVSMCDAGAIAVIDTTNSNANNPSGSGNPSDTLVTDLPAAFSAGAPQSTGEPPNQNPIFLLTGQ